jgi:NADP-dependent 3-hydroxy acid dehydrogenase YdfG
MSEAQHRVAVVTGASQGIGAAVVRGLATAGTAVGFCARGSDAVDALA